MGVSLIEAIRRRDEEEARRLLLADPSAVSERDEQGVSAVLLALYHGMPALADEIARGRDHLDVFEAAASGDLERVRQLILGDRRLVDAMADDGFTPLGLAAFFQQRQVVAFLLEAGADPNLASGNAMRVRPLHSAAAGGPDVEIVRLLLDAGAEVDARQRHGFTALHSAAQNGVLDQVQILLERGADPAALTDEGRSPLSYAEAARRPAVVERLRSAAPSSAR
jgi:ankyrin repeat protein